MVYLKDVNNNEIYQSLDSNGYVLEVTDAWLEAMGYERDEVIGKHFATFLDESSLPQVQKNFPHLKDYGFVDNVPLKVKQKDGVVVAAVLNGTSVYDENGEFKNTVCEIRTINDILNSESHIKTLLERERFLKNIIFLKSTVLRLTYKTESHELKDFLRKLIDVSIEPIEIEAVALNNSDHPDEIYAKSVNGQDIARLLQTRYFQETEITEEVKIADFEDLVSYEDTKKVMRGYGMNAIIHKKLVFDEKDSYNLVIFLNDVGNLKQEWAKAVDDFSKYIYNAVETIRITREKERLTRELEISHKKIRDSIEYASLIQNALLPDESVLDRFVKEHFVIWQPRDVVGGDIYSVVELSDVEVLIMVFDGAGHGVPGAFVTMMVKAIENQIVAEIRSGAMEPVPSSILGYFNRAIKTLLKQEKGSKSNAGFDGGILYLNRATKACRYAGAKADLYIVENGRLKVVEGDRKSVGYVRTKIDQTYTDHVVEPGEGAGLYLATDGIVDQEGDDNGRFGIERFENLLTEIGDEPMQKQKERIMESFANFKKSQRQTDDITVVGLRFD